MDKPEKKKSLILLSILFLCKGYAQSDLTFSKRFAECEDKWIAFEKGKEGTYMFGFIYIDHQAGLTLNYEGEFKIGEGNVFIRQPKIDSGIVFFKTRLKPDNGNVALIPSSKFDELKVKEIPEWLHIYKTYTDTANRLQRWGYYYNDWGMSEKALEYLEPGYRMSPDYKGMAVELAFAYNALGKYDKAIPVLNKAIELNPKDGYIYKELSFAHLKMGNLEEAEKVAEQGIKHYDDNRMKTEIAYNLTYSFYQLKNKDKFGKWAKETRKWATIGDQFSQSLDRMEEKMKE